MARPVRARAAARGYPAFAPSGPSGQGALQDSTRPGGPQAGQLSGTWASPANDPASVPAALPAPADIISTGLWGLPAAPAPDRTPRTHAAPLADPTLPVGEYFAQADAAHAADFGGPAELDPRWGTGAVGAVTGMALDHVTADGGDNSPLQPLTGQIRAMGGYDGTQGYGGGGDGPGGTNATMPLHTEQRAYPGDTYVTTVEPAEVTLLVPDPAQYVATGPEVSPWAGGGFDAPTSTVQAQDVITADSPAQGPALPQGGGLPAAAGSFWA